MATPPQRVTCAPEGDPMQTQHMGGPDLKRQRIAAFGYDNRAEFARLVGVKPRTVEGWESARGHVPPEKAELVRYVLGHHHQSWTALSDLDLIAALTERLRQYSEIAGRLAAHETGRDANVTETDGVSSGLTVSLPSSPPQSRGGRFTGRSGGPPKHNPSE